MTTFHVDSSTVRVWKRAGHWGVTVDGVVVAGDHATEARAAGAGLLQLMFTPVGRRRSRRSRVAPRRSPRRT